MHNHFRFKPFSQAVLVFKLLGQMGLDSGETRAALDSLVAAWQNRDGDGGGGMLSQLKLYLVN